MQNHQLIDLLQEKINSAQAEVQLAQQRYADVKKDSDPKKAEEIRNITLADKNMKNQKTTPVRLPMENRIKGRQRGFSKALSELSEAEDISIPILPNPLS